MTILKHLAIKNANYNDAFDYLTLQHDEFSMRPVLDENGLTMERAQTLGMEFAKKNFPGHQALLRSIIKDAICDSKDMTDFEKILLSRHSIEVHYSRGKIGFLLSGKTKVIRARQLGSFYEKESIEKQILTGEKGFGKLMKESIIPVSILQTKQPIKDILKLKIRLSLGKKTELKSLFLRLQEST